MARKRARTTRRPPRKRALLVGINQYPGAPLKGCVNDALMMGHLLVDHFGFKPGGDMRLLVDARATKSAILERVEWLVDGARAGDVLVLHYSGHGAQVPDRDGDEVDGTDECLCPIDFDWDDPFTDDDLGRIVDTVPDDVNLTMILDCCHSGTMTRDIAALTGNAIRRIVPPPDIQFRAVGNIQVTPGEEYFSVTMTSFRALPVRRFGETLAHNGILVAGCRSDQLSKDALLEGDYHGALTYSLFQSIRQRGPAQSYSEWLQSASDILRGYAIPDQDPQLESPDVMAGWQIFGSKPAAARRAPRRGRALASNKHVVYVHGICRHDEGYSDRWWQAMAPHVPSVPAKNRHEVLWSDIVTSSSRALEISPRDQAVMADRIREVLADRARRQLMEVAIAPGATRSFEAFGPRAVLGIPGVDCVDDFMKYLLSQRVRDRVIQRFFDKVRPLLDKGAEVEVISHSWGTVVAYEALRRMDTSTPLPPGRVHTLFTAGSALSIGLIKEALEDTAADGDKPRLVKRWVNLDARFDIVGGPLKGLPFAVDEEFLQLEPVSCSPHFPNPACAHSSYFEQQNTAVNRDIFGRFIEMQ